MAIIISLIALVANIIAITHSAYENNKLTCNRYIINSYLYVVLAILIMFFIIIVNDKTYFIQRALPFMFGSLISSIVFIIALIGLLIYFKTLDPTKDKILIHSIWTIIMVLLGMIMYPVVVSSKINNNLELSIGIVFVIICVTAYLGIKFGKQLFPYDWDKYLYYALIGFIVLTTLLTITKKMNNKLDLFITWGILIIFIILMISYNKKIYENSQKCIEHNNPNYLAESLSLITKIINVFARVARLMGRRRGRR